MKLHILPVLEQCFETIAEPFFSITLPSRVTKYVRGDVLLFEEYGVKGNVGFFTGRMALTVVSNAIKDGGNTHCKCKVLCFLNNTYLADHK